MSSHIGPPRIYWSEVKLASGKVVSLMYGVAWNGRDAAQFRVRFDACYGRGCRLGGNVLAAKLRQEVYSSSWPETLGFNARVWRAFKRHELARTLRNSGMMWGQIGLQLGVSKQRAQQIYQKVPRLS